MKKSKSSMLISCLLSICLALSLTACGGGGNGDNPNPTVENYNFEYATTLSDEEKPLYPEKGNGKTYYISSKGSDQNNGLSPETPFKTIKKMNTISLNPGDTIAFKKGEAFSGTALEITQSGTPDNPITVCSYGEGDKRPKIVAQLTNGIRFTNVSNLVIRDLEIVVIAKERVSASTSGSFTGIYGIINEKGNYKNIYIVNNLIHGKYTETSYGIRITSVLNFKDMPKDILNNVHILNNEVHDIGIGGINTEGWLSDLNKMNSDPYMYSNIYMNGNNVYNIGHIAMFLECSNHSEVNRNIVHHSAIFDKPFLNVGDTGIMALGCEDTDVMYNIVYAVSNACQPFDGMGIDIDWYTNRVNVQYNWVYDCIGSGIGTMANNNCFIRNNRVENNLCQGNQHGQIHVADFTTRYEVVPDDMHAVKNLIVENNYIGNNQEGKSHFNANENGGDSTLWSGNVFKDNHLVSNTNTNDFWIKVSEVVNWYKFEGNHYYKEDTSKFMVFENGQVGTINEEAKPYDGSGFEGWKKRDIGAVYQKLDKSLPSAVNNVTCSYNDGKLTLNWENKGANVWHHNIYLVKDGEEISYTNMLTEAFECSYTHQFEAKGTYKIVIEPESDQGIMGNPVTVTITLK